MNGDNLPYQTLDVVPFTPITSEWGDGVGDDILALAAGTGLDNGAITATQLASDAVTTAKLNNAAVTPNKLALSPATQTVATDEGTTSTSFADLSTVGPTVTVTIGANGLALVTWCAGLYNAAAQKYVGCTLSGANTSAAADADSIRNDISTFQGTQTFSKLYTGLNAGSTTFTLKYRTASGTARFFARSLMVTPL